MSVEKHSFSGLERIRLNILQKKINSGLLEFEKRPQIQWTSLALEKPLLQTLSKIVSENEALKIEVEHLRVIVANCECDE